MQIGNSMYTYYIVFEKHHNPNNYSKSWAIRKTENNLDTSEGLQREISVLDAESGCPVWLINWKRLNA